MVSYTYDPWGAPMSTDGTMASTLGTANPLRYRGYVYDTETGLYYLTSRYYNPVWGRFINADGYASTGQGFTGYNMFAYCNGNPLRYRDSGGSLPHNTMTMMTDGGTRDAQYYIKLQARRHAMNMSEYQIRLAGVRYTASTSTQCTVNESILGMSKIETGCTVTSRAFPDASETLLSLATVDFAGANSSINLHMGKNISSNLFLDGVGFSIAQSGHNDFQSITSLKINIFEGAIEVRTSTIRAEANGTLYTDYYAYSVKLWTIALYAILVEAGAPSPIPA